MFFKITHAKMAGRKRERYKITIEPRREFQYPLYWNWNMMLILKNISD